MPDYPNDFQQFSWFVSQFADAVEKGGYNTGFWFGRLLSFGYKFNLLDTEYKEYQIRQLLDDKDNNYFTEFDVSDIQYVPYADNPNYFIASATVKIVGKFDGNDIDGEYVIEHRIQRTWEAVYSKISKKQQLEEKIMQDETKKDERDFVSEDLKIIGIDESVSEALIIDDARYGNFATQYYGALRKWNYDNSATDLKDYGFWFGKMTTPQFRILNFFSASPEYGKAYWKNLVDEKYIFSAFSISRIAYTNNTVNGVSPYTYRTATATVQGTVAIKRVTDVTAIVYNFESVHQIRQIWAADETNYTTLTPV